MYANPQTHVDCESFLSVPASEKYDPEAEAYNFYYRKQQTQLPDNVRALRVLNREFPRRGKLLEVGCFTGTFLNRIRSDGWEVTGLEPFRPVAEYARSKHNLDIIEGVLPEPRLRTSHYDAVMMLHVIEHLPDPTDNLRELRRVLKPGGVLVIETPRFNSLSFKILGRRERSIQNCSGHIYFFTEQTLLQMLKQNGFDVFRVERVGRTLTLERLLFNIGLVSRSARVRRWLARVGQTRWLREATLYVNVRDMQRMYARVPMVKPEVPLKSGGHPSTRGVREKQAQPA